MTEKRELIARLRDECARRVGRKHFSRSDVEMVEACTAGADAIQRDLDATAAPSDILPIDAGNAADWLDRASSKWEHGPAAINPADALRLRSIAALLRATAAPVVVGEDTKRLDWLIENHALIETDGLGHWRIHYNWTSPDTYGPWGKDPRAAIDKGMTAALAGD